ncbi:MAG: 6,7-dimethyl-8-ribityllumazine synthase [bacterium]
MPKIIEGNFNAKGKKYAIVIARWNEFIVGKLLEGALDAFTRHEADMDNVTIIYCPGAYELPVLVKRIAATKEYSAVIALGAVIRGSTPHFDYIAAEVSKGIANAAMDTNVPCIFGVLTTDSIEQAIERAGTKAGNKGFEAAMSAIEMADLFGKL